MPGQPPGSRRVGPEARGSVVIVVQNLHAASFHDGFPPAQVHRLEHMTAEIDRIQQTMKNVLEITEIRTRDDQCSSRRHHADVFVDDLFKIRKVLDEAERTNHVEKAGRLELQEISLIESSDLHSLLMKSRGHPGQHEWSSVDPADFITKAPSQMN